MSYQLSELTPSLTVNKIFIDIKNLNYKELCECFEPSGNIVAINNNFFHKSLEGYESYITKPKSKKTKRKSVAIKKVVGDGSTFNSSIEFMVSIDDHIRLLRYYPRSGQVQIIGCQYSQELIDKFIDYLRNSGVKMFSSVKFESGPHSLLQNYKFAILLGEKKYVNIKNLAECLENDKELIDNCPFPIQYVKHSKTDIHSKIAIVFTNKIRIHIWMKSGKVNILGTVTEWSASLIHKFIHEIFSMRYDDFVCNAPEPDLKS